MSDASLEALAGLPRLRDLETRNSSISRYGFEQLTATIPKCQIKWSEPNRLVAEQVLALRGREEALISLPYSDQA